MTARASKGILKTIDASTAGFDKAFEKLCRRRDDSGEEAEKAARKIVEKVRDEGDEAVAAFTKKFDKASLDVFEVDRDEWEAGCEAMDPADRAALGKAAMRVREFHRKRIASSWEMRT